MYLFIFHDYIVTGRAGLDVHWAGDRLECQLYGVRC
jgi:hypothetical protein